MFQQRGHEGGFVKNSMSVRYAIEERIDKMVEEGGLRDVLRPSRVHHLRVCTEGKGRALIGSKIEQQVRVRGRWRGGIGKGRFGC